MSKIQSMLYRIFKVLFYLTVKAYFRSIYVKGKENVPQSGPVIFAANHNSAFMDPILLGVEINRILYFLARGDVFKSKFAAWFFNLINMIPVYLPDLSPDEVHKNDEIFNKCFEHLKKGKSIMIFPEGKSRTERRMRPIKTGTARISLGAESQNHFQLGVKIIPIGINYSNPHHFRSDVFVNFGEPINVKDYREKYTKDEWDGVSELTERIKSELENLVVIIEDERLERIIQSIEVMYRSKLRDESKPHEKAPQDFYLSKDIVKGVEYYAKYFPNKLEEFEKKVDAYLKRLKRLKIRDTQVRTSKISFNIIWQTLYFTFGFPIFLYGLIFNIIPYKIAEFVSKKVIVRHDFIGSLKLAAGMFIFLFLYLIEGALVHHFFSFYLALAFLISLYPIGLFTVNYIKNYYVARGTLKYIGLFLKKSDLVAALKQERKELVDILEEGRELFLKSQNN